MNPKERAINHLQRRIQSFAQSFAQDENGNIPQERVLSINPASSYAKAIRKLCEEGRISTTEVEIVFGKNSERIISFPDLESEEQ